LTASLLKLDIETSQIALDLLNAYFFRLFASFSIQKNFVDQRTSSIARLSGAAEKESFSSGFLEEVFR